MKRTPNKYLVLTAVAGTLALGGLLIYGVPQQSSAQVSAEQAKEAKSRMTTDKKLELATFGGGCFWCTEAVYQELQGVHSVTSGYSGGKSANPTYREVCSGLSGHAEVVQIEFDPQQVSYADLLEVFWRTHDPTTLNRQGADVGTQYRSVIYFHNDQQKAVATELRAKLDDSGAFAGPIVTEISPFEKFYAAEDYHQDYFQLNPTQGYCRAVIAPKLDKFRKAFQGKLKSTESKDAAATEEQEKVDWSDVDWKKSTHSRAISSNSPSGH